MSKKMNGAHIELTSDKQQAKKKKASGVSPGGPYNGAAVVARAIKAMELAASLTGELYVPSMTRKLIEVALRDEFEPLPRSVGRPKKKVHAHAHTRLYRTIQQLNLSTMETRA